MIHRRFVCPALVSVLWVGASCPSSSSPSAASSPRSEPTPSAPSEAPAVAVEATPESARSPSEATSGSAPVEAAEAKAAGEAAEAEAKDTGEGEAGPSEAPSVASPPSAYVLPADPYAMLLTEGNRWEHTTLTGWNSDLQSAGIVHQRITAVKTLGPYTVATVEIDNKSDHSFAEARVWVRKGDRLYLIEADIGYMPPLTTAKEVRAAVRGTTPTFDLARAKPGLGCGMQGCIGGLVIEDDVEALVLWPGVGFIEQGVDGPYSPETGDGLTTSMHLRRAWLGKPIRPVIEPEPPAARRARELARAALGRSEYRRFSEVRPSLDFSNRKYPFFHQLLEAHGPKAWSLGKILATECRLVRGPVDVLTCPGPHAGWSAAVGDGAEPRPTEARAYFVRRGERFELAAAFAGSWGDIVISDDDGDQVLATKWPAPDPDDFGG